MLHGAWDLVTDMIGARPKGGTAGIPIVPPSCPQPVEESVGLTVSWLKPGIIFEIKHSGCSLGTDLGEAVLQQLDNTSARLGIDHPEVEQEAHLP